MATWQACTKATRSDGLPINPISNTETREYGLGEECYGIVTISSVDYLCRFVYCRAGYAITQYDACMTQWNQVNPFVVVPGGYQLTVVQGNHHVAGVCSGGAVTADYYFWMQVAPGVTTCRTIATVNFGNTAGAAVQSRIGNFGQVALATTNDLFPGFGRLGTTADYNDGHTTITVVLTNTAL